MRSSWKWGIPFRSGTNEYNREYRIKNTKQVILYKIKSRALKHGLDFNLDLDDLPDDPICPVLNTKLSYDSKEKDKTLKASVDRIDPTKGYTKDNIKIISFRANTLKNNASLEELESLVRYVKTNS